MQTHQLEDSKILRSAKPIDLKEENKKFHQRDKQIQREQYQARYDDLLVDEVQRLKRNSRCVVVHEFDCGPCARCKKKVCDENACKQRLRRFSEQEEAVDGSS